MSIGRKSLLVLVLAAAALGAVPAYQYWKREYGPLDDSMALAAWHTWQGPKYTRAECMVRLRFEAKPYSDKEWDAWFPTFTRYLYNHEPRALFTASTDRHGNMYLQFFDECPRRHEIARAMVAYFERRHGTAVNFTVTDDRVEPGPDTMQACGRVWTDCEPPPGGWRAEPRTEAAR